MAVSKATAVGGFVLGGLTLGVLAIVLFGGFQLFTSNLRVVVFFQDSVAGLAVGAPVTLRGVKVGTVRSMKVYLKLPELVPVIPVYLDIQPGQVSWTNGTLRAGAADVQIAVQAGLRAQLATQSLVTGQLSVNLDFYPQISANLTGTDPQVPEIPSIPSDLQHIKDEIKELKLADLTEKARVALTSIEQLAAELTGKLGPMADSLRQTSDAARATLETTGAAVQQLRADASRTLDDIDSLAVGAKAQIATTGKQLDTVMTALNRTVTKADTVVASLHDMTGPRAPLRGDLEATLRDLSASAASLRNFSRDLERNPGGTLLGRSSR